MAEGTIRVTGYREFLHACNRADATTKKEVRATFREVGEIVRADAARLFAAYGKAGRGAKTYGGTRASHADSAAGFRVRVRLRGVEIEQSKPRTTGKHPEYGGVQMRHALIPGRDRNEGRVERAFEHALDHIADQFDNL